MPILRPTRCSHLTGLLAAGLLLVTAITGAGPEAEPGPRGSFLDSLEAHLRRGGFAPWTDEDEQKRTVDWLLHVVDASRSSVRNVAYEELLYLADVVPGDDRVRIDVSINDVEVSYPREGTQPPRFSAATRFVVLRTEGYPSRYLGSERTVLMALKVFDGRQLLVGQFPGLFYRAAPQRLLDGTERTVFHLVQGDYIPLADENDSRPAGFAGRPQGSDVLAVEQIHERDGARAKRLLDEGGLAYAINPWTAVFESRTNPRPAAGLRVLMLDDARSRNLHWWRSDDRIAVLDVNQDAEAPGALLFLFERKTGLPLEYSSVGFRGGKWKGHLRAIDYVDIRTDEGEVLRMPASVVRAGNVSGFFVEALSLPGDDIAYMSGERSQFFHYTALNTTRLDADAAFSFDRFATRLGMRLAPIEQPTAAEMDMPTSAHIYGPPRWDEHYERAWDQANLAAIRRSGIPHGPHDVLPYEELLSMVRPGGGQVYRAYYLDDDGSPVELPPYGSVPESVE